MILTLRDGKIHVRESDGLSIFDAETGRRLSGPSSLVPDDVLFFAWRQTQSSRLTNQQLRKKWEAR